MIASVLIADAERSSSRASANAKEHQINPELFTHSARTVSHVQIIKVQPTTLTRILRLTGAVAYNGFRTIPVITQVSGPVNRIVVFPGSSKSRRSPCCTSPAPIIRSCARTI